MRKIMEEQQGREHWLEWWLSENSAKVLLWVLGVAVALAVVAIATYVGFYLGAGDTFDPEKLGQTGDYFGGLLNPALSFLSVFALLVTIVIQSRELRLSREALKVSQDELTLSRKEQAKAAEALNLQNRAIQKQSFEQSFFAWLHTYREVLGEIRSSGERQGRPALMKMWRDFLAAEYVSAFHAIVSEDHSISNALARCGITYVKDAHREHYMMLAKGASSTWEDLYKEYETELDSFFRVLFRLIQWIDEQAPAQLSAADKWHYVSIVRSQLSWIEMVFLFYNGMTQRGEKFKSLIERYALFDNLTTHSDALLVVLRENPMDAVGYKKSAFSSDEARASSANN